MMTDPTGIRFSQLKDSWEERSFHYDFTMEQNNRHDAVFRCYGSLPDGTLYGAFIFPLVDPDPSATYIVIIGKDDKLVTCTPAEYLDWDLPDHWPLAVVSSPSGNTIIWIIGKELRTWHKDPEEGRFINSSDYMENRLGKRQVIDAVMNADGLLEILCENGEKLGYLADADIVLSPRQDGWIPAEGKEYSNLVPWHKGVPQKKDCMRALPGYFILMIRKEDGWEEYAGCGVRRVCFEEGLERIEGEVLAENPELESVVIPASVRYVEFGAFRDCKGLKELVIEGDPMRIADWDREAFLNCPCEEYYLQLRRDAEEHSRQIR